MNRIIKFRAWNKDANIICNDLSTWDNNINLSDYFNEDSFVFMQYTWLKDKNWKEIFEGDIIRDWEGELIVIDWKHYDTDSYPIINCDFNMFIYIVEYSESHSWLWSRTQEDIEIIWNIYENKDLLNND